MSSVLFHTKNIPYEKNVKKHINHIKSWCVIDLRLFFLEKRTWILCPLIDCHRIRIKNKPLDQEKKALVLLAKYAVAIYTITTELIFDRWKQHFQKTWNLQKKRNFEMLISALFYKAFTKFFLFIVQNTWNFIYFLFCKIFAIVLTQKIVLESSWISKKYLNISGNSKKTKLKSQNVLHLLCAHGFKLSNGTFIFSMRAAVAWQSGT